MLFKKIFPFASILYFLILPFVFWPGLTDPYELPKVILFICSVNILIGFYILGILTNNIPNVKLKTIHLLLIAQIVIITISSLFSDSFSRSFFGQYFRYQGILTYFSYFSFFLLFSSSLFPKEQLAKIISLGGTLVAVYLIIEFFLLNILKLPIYHYNLRLAANFGNPNFAAGFLALSFPFMVFYPFIGIPLLLSWFIFFIGLLLTGSLSGLLAFFIVSVLVLRIKYPEKTFLLLLVFLPAMAFLIFSLTLRPASSFDNRLIIWQKAVIAFSKKPILGYGIENFEPAFISSLSPADFDLKRIRVDKAHNEILEIAVTSGIIGLAVYFLILKEVVFSLWKNRKSLWVKTNLLCLIAFFSLSLLNVLNINEYLFFYLIISTVANL